MEESFFTPLPRRPIFENDFKLTEEGENGIALYNKRNDRVAVFDQDGNLHIKGKVISDL